MTQRGSHPDTAERMLLLRTALGYNSQTAFAAFVGVSPARWNNVERGYPVSFDLAMKLVQKIPGLSLDWIKFGTEDALSVAMLNRLRQVAESQRVRKKA